MKENLSVHGWWRTFGYAIGIGLVLSPGFSWALEIDKAPLIEKRETISLADAALRALRHNLDIRSAAIRRRAGWPISSLSKPSSIRL